MYLQFINSDKHLPQGPLQVNYLDDDILLWCLCSFLVRGPGPQVTIREMQDKASPLHGQKEKYIPVR